ncbi:His Kinase A (phospho-acceptor) domain-containing protein [Quadrisphaera granulorum]|uniref:Sensor-like histidine kinase SenX3 n=1 Tax=Quadrisphaera granulorum TaxID=317664 RepID=A0A316B0R7_9ACTN|nr:HAMP domain-containing sensor histidine kinase [Quadrisphaera granulorum]PWJ56087.1 phospho-acceptor domain-containing protein [Quadrisphaera granulorum]SZE94721.1 His Kinase A (phospho-acceptor) domain-containing protein [Quadrisphaera granulorum]
MPSRPVEPGATAAGLPLPRQVAAPVVTTLPTTAVATTATTPATTGTSRSRAALLRRVRAVTGWPWASIELPEQLLPTSLAFAAAERRSAVHLPDAAALPHLASNPWVDGRIARTRAVAAVPVLGPQGRLLGVLLARDEVPHPADAEREEALSDLANLASGMLLAERQQRSLGGLAAAVAAADQRVAVAQAGLEDRHDLLEAVLETADVGVVALNGAGRVTVLNPIVRAWAGLPEELDATAAARAATTALCTDTAGTVLAAVRGPLLATLDSGTETRTEVVFAASSATSSGGDAEVTCVCRTRALTTASGARVGVVASLTDVTAEREAQAELERSNAELEAFAGIAAHDLRSPLTVVDGYLEVLEEDAEARGDARAAAWSATARRSAGRMASLLQALLAYASVGAPDQVRREPVAVRALLEAVLADLAVPGDAVVVLPPASTSSPSRAAEVTGDPVQLHQLLTNLVGNALKFTRPGEPAHVTCAVREDADEWEITVADRGPGVPLDQRTAVFRAFERGTHRRGGAPGHGLGLATAQRIVARHGGHIALDETPGGGLTVRVRLPRP